MDLSERPAAELARRHPWERARFRFFASVLREAGLQPSRVLDAGAGDGWFVQQLLSELPETARATCWDAYYNPQLIEELSGHPRVSFTRERPRERFPLVLLLDVLEHVEDDHAFLRSLVSENAEHSVLISVPAWPGLFTQHDTMLRHHRRYRPEQAARVIEASGLSIVHRGGAFHGLLLPRALEKARELIGAGPPPASLASWSGGPTLTRAVDLALVLDARLSHFSAQAGVELPGLSWWALCERR